MAAASSTARPRRSAVLPEIVDAVGDKTEVQLDGGIRSGQDVLKALALGAKGTYIGRAMLYGLGAGGEAGVTRALEIIRKELDITHGAMRRAQYRCRRPGSSLPSGDRIADRAALSARGISPAGRPRL